MVQRAGEIQPAELQAYLGFPEAQKWCRPRRIGQGQRYKRGQEQKASCGSLDLQETLEGLCQAIRNLARQALAYRSDDASLPSNRISKLPG
jgi:hypothetical protein